MSASFFATLLTLALTFALGVACGRHFAPRRKIVWGYLADPLLGQFRVVPAGNGETPRT